MLGLAHSDDRRSHSGKVRVERVGENSGSWMWMYIRMTWRTCNSTVLATASGNSVSLHRASELALKKNNNSRGDADPSGLGATLWESLIQIFPTVRGGHEGDPNLNRHNKDAEEGVFLISI